MNFEWVLDQSILKYGYDYIINKIDTKNLVIPYIPDKVLAYILGYIDRKSFTNCKLVCKKWEQCMEKDEFWNQFIKMRMTSDEYPLVSNHTFFDANTFNPQTISIPEFDKKVLHAFFVTGKYFHIKSMIDGKLTFGFHVNQYFARFEWLEKGKYSLEMTSKVGKKEGISVRGVISCPPLGSEIISIRYDILNSCDCQTTIGCACSNKTVIAPFKTRIEIQTDYGYYKGDAFVLEPHGKGKWTFTDDTTHTGDNIAFAGVPNGLGEEGRTFFNGLEIKKKKI